MYIKQFFVPLLTKDVHVDGDRNQVNKQLLSPFLL